MRFKKTAASTVSREHANTSASDAEEHVDTTSASVCRTGSQLSPEPQLHNLLNPYLLRPPAQVATHDSHETDFQGALHDRWSQQDETAFELVYFDLGRKLDFIEVLLLLGHIRAGFFAAVHLAPPANTWSRVRHSSADQPRKQPLRLRSLSPPSQAKVDQSNREIEIVTSLCPRKTTGIFFIFSEDLGGHEHSGPGDHLE